MLLYYYNNNWEKKNSKNNKQFTVFLFQVFFQQGRQQNLKSPRMGKLFFIIFQRGVPTYLLTFHRLPAAKINKNYNSNKIINFEREIYSFSLSLSFSLVETFLWAERQRGFENFLVSILNLGRAKFRSIAFPPAASEQWTGNAEILSKILPKNWTCVFS